MKRLMTMACVALLLAACSTPACHGNYDSDTVNYNGETVKVLKGLRRSDFSGYSPVYKLTTTNRGECWHDKYLVENEAATLDVDLMGKADSGIIDAGLTIMRSMAGANANYDLKPAYRDALLDFCKTISKSPMPLSWCMRHISRPNSDTTIDGWRYRLASNEKIIDLTVEPR